MDRKAGGKAGAPPAPRRFGDLARWQLATGTTVLEGWVRVFGRAVRFDLGVGYLLTGLFGCGLILLFDKPVWLIVVYAAVSALFMPFLAGTLLVMNNRKGDMGGLRNGIPTNLALLAALALFVYLAVVELGAGCR